MSRRRHEAKIAWWQQQENAALTERNEALKENRRLRDELDRLRAAVALHRPVNRGLVLDGACRRLRRGGAGVSTEYRIDYALYWGRDVIPARSATYPDRSQAERRRAALVRMYGTALAYAHIEKREVGEWEISHPTTDAGLDGEATG